FGIDDHGGPMLALVKAPGLVSPYSPFQTSPGHAGFEELMQLAFSAGIARTFRMPFRPLIGADEDVFVELGHLDTSVLLLYFNPALASPGVKRQQVLIRPLTKDF